MSAFFDLAITGAGPAGTACALAAARAGWKVALIERADFPRHKVCGDCLNPSVWPVLEDLGTAATIRALPHAPLQRVRFVSQQGRALEIPLPPGAEWAVTRESFDNVMLEAALGAGVVLFSGNPLTHITRREHQWHLATSAISLTARTIVAADGRNSTTCRLLGLAPAAHAGRVALQCHAPLAMEYQGTVSLELTPHGYCGIAPVDDTRMNLCLVSHPPALAEAKREAHRRFELPDDQIWHSIAPLERPDISPAPLPGCFLAGDAARVVEPFTGEGIYYALRSGQLAAIAAGQLLSGHPHASRDYRQAHRALYRNRLWVNRLARYAVTQPWLGSLLLRLGHIFPSVVAKLTAKVIPANSPHPLTPT